MSATFDRSWIWHPSLNEQVADTAGLFVHFRRHFSLDPGKVPKSLKICITADTKYKLYVNHQLAGFGPVKGDHNLWFYDVVDIGPYLRDGENHIGVHVLRFFYSTQYAPSFPRLATGGLRVTVPDEAAPWPEYLSTSSLWETAVDPSGRLRVDEPEDVFLHTYEAHTRIDKDLPLQWMSAEILQFKNSTGNSPPWHLSPSLIPKYRIVQNISFTEIHNLQSDVSIESWNKVLLDRNQNPRVLEELHLAPGSQHQLELEMAHHTTAFIRALFKRPAEGGGYVKVTYAESYEEEPDLYKGERKKAHRRDTSKMLLGPHDIYYFQGATELDGVGYYDEKVDEIFAPFHFRTFRFIKLDILVGPAELVFGGLDIESAHYPLDVAAAVSVKDEDGSNNTVVQNLWQTSLRTLINCMHDCYEDCPFYEQMQYAMDTRSSALFTYCVSGDDTLARQAIIQLYNSFQPRVGLTASRAPTHRQQFIPHFSLYWICMLCDHFDYYGDEVFLSQFMSVADGILSYFESRVDSKLGLVKLQFGLGTGVWHFVDWVKEWKPYGYPSVCEQTGLSTYTNELYAYTLRAASKLISALGRPALANEYDERAKRTVSAIQNYCFDGEFFTDGLASDATVKSMAHSQHSQVWAVLSGAISGSEAQKLLRRSSEQARAGSVVQESVSMSFYTLRALAIAGGDVYEDHFHNFWKPWLDQLALGVTTWVEDAIAQRSDCHAWGSVPLYEFMAQVAGVRPAEPGWKAIEFQPRLKLYPNLNATVPVGMINGETMEVVHVSWNKCDTDGNVKLIIRGEKQLSRPIPLHIRLPGQDIRLKWTGHLLELVIKV